MKTEQVLLSRQDEIVQRWLEQVRESDRVKSDRQLSHSETLDSLPDIINAIAQVLAEPSTTDIRNLFQEGIGHGKVRARQGYDAEEIICEYAILREIILQVLATELSLESAADGTPAAVFALVGKVNSAVDTVVACSMKRYADERLRELNMLYDELMTSNQELDRIVRNEQTNLAHLAHELKSPLSSIIGYSDLFLRRQAKEGSVHPEYVQQALDGGRRLLGTINNALEMSSYRAGKVSLAPQSVDVCEVVSEVATALRIMAQQKGLDLLVECQGDRQIVTDKARLRQVVTNLLSNAIRYTDSGHIRVCTRCETDRIEIQVEDTGHGIEAFEQGLIFEPYYQGKAGQQLQSSTGLGLAITNQIVRLLQGSIQLRSKPEVGSTFTISLPLKMDLELDASEVALPANKAADIQAAKTHLEEMRSPEPIRADSRSTGAQASAAL